MQLFTSPILWFEQRAGGRFFYTVPAWLVMAVYLAYFKELCLIFGGVSSAGILEYLAKIVLFVVVQKSGFGHDMVCQHLNDCCPATPFNSNTLELCDAVFSEVAIELGVKQAPRDDPKKSFSPAQSGIILGVHYDTTSWTWSLPEEKLIQLLHLL